MQKKKGIPLGQSRTRKPGAGKEKLQRKRRAGSGRLKAQKGTSEKFFNPERKQV